MSDQVTTSLAQAKVLVMQGMAGKAPRINAENNHWEVYDNATGQWVDTGYSCNGAEGLNGNSPYINESGYWVVYDDEAQQWVTTDVMARGVNGTDGVSPTVTITEITRGHRVTITDAEHPNGQNFDVMNGFNGLNGTNGVDGHSPYIDPTTNTWWYFDDASGLWVDSHVDPDGYPGPAGTDGADGADGYSPAVTITNITGGHRVTITDKTHPQGQSFDVMDGEDGQGGGDSKVVYLSYDSSFDDDPAITVTSSNSSYATAATIAPALENTTLRNVRFEDEYTEEVYDLVGYNSSSSSSLTFACVKNNAIKFCTMTGTSGKPVYSSVPISGGGSAPFEIPITQSGDTYTTTATAADILAHADNCVAVLQGTKLTLDYSTVNGNNAVLLFSVTALDAQYPEVTNLFVLVSNGTVTVTIMTMDIKLLPSVTSTDNGKSLVVENGAWVASGALQTKAITDTGNYFTTDTVEGALQEIGAELSGINTLIGSGVIT